MTHTDEELLHAWSGGDRAAGECLFRRHYDRIALFFHNKIGEGCDDQIQVTFTLCLESIANYRGDSSFRTYLFGIARNVLLQYLRSKQRDAAHIDPAIVSIAESMPSCATVIASSRVHEQLLLALRELPIDTQVMLELHYWEELTIQEIAQIVEMPVNTVKTRMRRGRLKLYDVLGYAGREL